MGNKKEFSEDDWTKWAKSFNKYATSNLFNERASQERNEFNKGGLAGLTEGDAKRLLEIIKETFNLEKLGVDFSGIFNIDGKKITYDKSVLKAAIIEINQLMSNEELPEEKKKWMALRALIYGYVAAISSKKPIYVKYTNREQLENDDLHNDFKRLHHKYQKWEELSKSEQEQLAKEIIILFKFWERRGILLIQSKENRTIIGDGTAQEIETETGEIIANAVIIVDGNGNMKVTTAHEILGHALAKNFDIINSANTIHGLKIPAYNDGSIDIEVISHEVEAVIFENLARLIEGIDKRDPVKELHGIGEENNTKNYVDAMQRILRGDEIPIIVQPAFWRDQLSSPNSPFVSGTPMTIEQETIKRGEVENIKNPTIEELKKRIKDAKKEIDKLRRKIKELKKQKAPQEEIDKLREKIDKIAIEIGKTEYDIKAEKDRIKRSNRKFCESQNTPEHNNSLFDTLSQINDALYANNSSNSSEDVPLSPLLWRGSGGEVFPSQAQVADQYQTLPGTDCQFTLTEEIQPDMDALIADALISILLDSGNVAEGEV